MGEKVTASDADPGKLVVLGFDAAEAAQRRRIRSFLTAGFDVLGLTMRRENMTHDAAPFWENIDLGQTRNGDLKQRVAAIARALPKLWSARRRMRGADAIVARNLDMLVLGVAARAMLRPQPRLVYECLDIHGMMTNQGPKGRLARAVERWCLRRCSALITSSPAFFDKYFKPVQGWNGPVHLLENKLWIDGHDLPRPSLQTKPEGSPIILGWVGTLRCPQSLDILTQVAERMGEKVQIRLHGIVHYEMLPDFDARVSRQTNISWHGAYTYPAGLAEIYTDCDAVWAQDLWQWGTNSTWLLPNRIYEAGYFGCPSIAVAGTQTGIRVEKGLGWTIPQPNADALCALLSRLTREDVTDARRDILAQPDDTFRQNIAEIRAAVSP